MAWFINTLSPILIAILWEHVQCDTMPGHADGTISTLDI